MNLDQRINAFVDLGNFLRQLASGSMDLKYDWEKELYQEAQVLVNNIHIQNPWFTPGFVQTALAGIGQSLQEKLINQWLKPYQGHLVSSREAKNIGVISAGNIPLVGFHDLLCVVISGNVYQGKLSSKDNQLPGLVKNYLVKWDPGFDQLISFTEDQLTGFDAVIATGSNNTSRYFEYYFGKYPHIIRKNRNSVAVLTGNESPGEMASLADDAFLYFGFGCRNVSKVYVPENYDFIPLFKIFEDKYKHLAQHHKFDNNYQYNRTIYLMNKEKHFDLGYCTFKQDTAFSSPISVVHYETYQDIDQVKKQLQAYRDHLQCVVGKAGINGEIPFGQSQFPGLADYADEVDTMEFLLGI